MDKLIYTAMTGAKATMGQQAAGDLKLFFNGVAAEKVVDDPIGNDLEDLMPGRIAHRIEHRLLVAEHARHAHGVRVVRIASSQYIEQTSLFRCAAAMP